MLIPTELRDTIGAIHWVVDCLADLDIHPQCIERMAETWLQTRRQPS